MTFFFGKKRGINLYILINEKEGSFINIVLSFSYSNSYHSGPIYKSLLTKSHIPKRGR